MYILGISCFYHDSAACLVASGRIVAAAQEERFTRKKHDNRFPSDAVQYCLEAGGLRAEQLDYVVFYEKPLQKFERLLESYIAYYHQDRPHLSLEKDTPVPRPVSNKPRGGGTVIALPRVGGLHHRYEWRKAGSARVSQLLTTKCRMS